MVEDRRERLQVVTAAGCGIDRPVGAPGKLTLLSNADQTKIVNKAAK